MRDHGRLPGRLGGAGVSHVTVSMSRGGVARAGLKRVVHAVLVTARLAG